MNFLIFQGVLCRTLQGHGHWVNILALSTDYVMRTGAFDPASATVVHSEVTDTGKCQLYCVMYCMQRAATDYWHCKCQHHCVMYCLDREANIYDSLTIVLHWHPCGCDTMADLQLFLLYSSP